MRAWSMAGAVAVLAACGQEVGKPAPSSARLVVLGSSLAEIVCDLGEGGRIAGLDQSAAHLQTECPEAAVLSYHRQLSSEGVLSLKPDLVLATDQAGPEAAVAQVRGAGVRWTSFPEHYTWAGALEKTRAVAAVLNISEKAEPLIQKMEAQKAAAEARFRAAGAGAAPPRVLFVMSMVPGSHALMAAGEGTAAQAVIELAGGRNAVCGFERYKPVSNEALLEADPEVILFARASPQGSHGFQDSRALCEHPALKESSAVRRGRVHPVDLSTALNFGSRTGETLEAWSGLLHPAGGLQAARRP
jgi:iron complex transport system substrate-binding protein